MTNRALPCEAVGVNTLLVVSGPPGAGKSTVARLLAARLEPSALVEGDDFYRFLCNGAIEPWKREARRQNQIITSIEAATAGRYVIGGYHTVFDGVLGPWFIERFTAAAAVPVDYAVVLPSVEACLARIRTRVAHGFHDEAAARSMHEQFIPGAIDDRHLIDSTSLTAEQTADEIESRRLAGSLRL